MSLPAGRICTPFGDDPWSITSIKMASIANSAYVHWTMATGEVCPDALSDLEKYRNSRSTRDAWGGELLMLCDDGLGEGISLASAGPDGAFGSEDDIEYPSDRRNEIRLRVRSRIEAFYR